jgi:hypothetical protein
MLDVLNLIPAGFYAQILGVFVDFISGLAVEVLGDRVGAKIGELRSDRGFRKAFRASLQSATKRFIREYEMIDEDLVEAIASDKGFFRNKQVQPYPASLPTLSDPHGHD